MFRPSTSFLCALKTWMPATSAGMTRASELEQIEIFVLFPGGNVGLFAAFGHEPGVLGFFDVGEILNEAVAKAFAKHLISAERGDRFAQFFGSSGASVS